jgi:hypothetical protein
MAQNGSGKHASGLITFVPPWLGVLSGRKRFLHQGNDWAFNGRFSSVANC